MSVWADNGLARFLYEYGKGQWWDYGVAWNKIGGLSASSAFLGDGTWHTMSPDWAFSYDSSVDAGTWRRVAYGSSRFQYLYNGGLWLSTSPFNGGVWNLMGPPPTSPYSSAFIGDGAWHSLGTDWSYLYSASTDSAQMKYQGNLQFAYNYGIGQWSHYDRIFATWRELSATGRAAWFTGFGIASDLGNGWYYGFSGGVGYWDSHTSTVGYFRYDYSSGQWLFVGGALGTPGLSAAFIGDGAQHDLNNGWLFAYDKTPDSVMKFYRNETGTPLRFSMNGVQWYHYDDTNAAEMTGFNMSTVSAAWLLDGQLHSGNAWLFAYDYGNDELRFYAQVAGTPSATSPVSFLKYSYVDHRWHDRRALSTASWCLIPTDGVGAEIQRTYWAGLVPPSSPLGYRVAVSPNPNWLAIYAQYAAPIEEFVTSAPTYRYNYGTGTWTQFDNATSTWITVATDANPDLYR